MDDDADWTDSQMRLAWARIDERINQTAASTKAQILMHAGAEAAWTIFAEMDMLQERDLYDPLLVAVANFLATRGRVWPAQDEGLERLRGAHQAARQNQHGDRRREIRTLQDETRALIE